MTRFLLRRLLFYGLAGCTAIVLNFIIPRMMPGDPASIMFARFQGKVKPEALEAMKETFGLSNEPMLVQFYQYLQALSVGDLGVSLIYFPEPVSSVMVGGLVWTTLLAGSSLLISFVLGTLLGAYLAWRRDGILDSSIPPLFTLLGAFPYFWMAMVTLSIFGFTLGWFPTRHAYRPEISPGFSVAFLYSVFVHAFLPACTMVIASIGGWLLSMRNTMITSLGTEYVHYAQIRGLSSKRVLLGYAARNALIPNV